MNISLRKTMALWAALTVACGALFLAASSTGFGWPQLIAVTVPHLLWIARGASAWWIAAAGAIALVGTALLGATDSGASLLWGLLLPLAAFLGGVALGTSALRRHREMEGITRDIVSRARSRRRDPLARALERELARSRRHEHDLTVLSVAPVPRNIVPQRTEPLTHRTLQLLSEQRMLVRLADALREQLRPYCEVVVAADQVLALVPELGAGESASLCGRLQSVLDQVLEGETAAIGAASFPADAVTAAALLEAADTDRRRGVLHAVDDSGPMEGESSLLGAGGDGPSSSGGPR